MKLKSTIFSVGLLLLLYLGCSSTHVENETEPDSTKDEAITDDTQNATSASLKILALGDSYTIGESVCASCRFPEQLKDSIIKRTGNEKTELKVIATTGWTTTNLKQAILNADLKREYNLATLLIGVNNQFQGKPFNLFQKEFVELVNDATKYLVKPSQLIVISIPDYAFTPFGNANNNISVDIDKYNSFIENYCNNNLITYIYITDITRQGLQKPELVANDGLHPSTLAYTEFVKRILPEALEKIRHGTN